MIVTQKVKQSSGVGPLAAVSVALTLRRSHPAGYVGLCINLIILNYSTPFILLWSR